MAALCCYLKAASAASAAVALLSLPGTFTSHLHMRRLSSQLKKQQGNTATVNNNFNMFRAVGVALNFMLTKPLKQQLPQKLQLCE